MFILHIIVLCTGNNLNNNFRTTFSLLWRLTVRLEQFRNFKSNNHHGRLHTRNAHQNHSIRSNNIEVQPDNLENFAIQHITWLKLYMVLGRPCLTPAFGKATIKITCPFSLLSLFSLFWQVNSLINEPL